VTILTALGLGVIQGLTEFLPVSSSAHLILGHAVFGWEENAASQAFDVSCHVGTLLAVLVFFRTDILALIRAVPRAFSPRPTGDARRLWLIVAGTIPVVIVGVFFSKFLEAHARTPWVAVIALAALAPLFFVVERLRSPRRGEATISFRDAFLIGIAQSCALIPGVSRSGSTIVTGMMLGLDRASAARFTFILSVPAVLAAAAKEGLELRHMGLSSHDMTVFCVGAGVSAVVGYAAIALFLRYLMSHRLDIFGWYRLALAAAGGAWLLASTR
jgi:undecaprenyl-diphosphatase